MRRNLTAPLVLGLVALAGCGGATKWSSAVAPPTKALARPGPAPAVASKADPTTARRISPTPAHKRTAPAPGSKKKVKEPGTPTRPGVSAAANGAVNESGAVSRTSTLPATVRAGWLPYYDPSGIALQHPAAWTVQPGGLGPMVVSIDGVGVDKAGFRRNINVLEQPLTDGLTAADYERASVKQIIETGGIVDNDRAAVLGGATGRQVIWHVTKAAKTTGFLSVWAVKGQLGYLVTYSSDQHNFATPLLDVRRVIASMILPR
jgi:hypothetical protein